MQYFKRGPRSRRTFTPSLHPVKDTLSVPWNSLVAVIFISSLLSVPALPTGGPMYARLDNLNRNIAVTLRPDMGIDGGCRCVYDHR